MNNIVAAFRGMHVSPAKHSYEWLSIKCDYQTNTHTDGQTDRHRTKWSLCVAMLRRQHKKVLWNKFFHELVFHSRSLMSFPKHMKHLDMKSIIQTAYLVWVVLCHTHPLVHGHLEHWCPGIHWPLYALLYPTLNPEWKWHGLHTISSLDKQHFIYMYNYEQSRFSSIAKRVKLNCGDQTKQ